MKNHTILLGWAASVVFLLTGCNDRHRYDGSHPRGYHYGDGGGSYQKHKSKKYKPKKYKQKKYKPKKNQRNAWRY